jgi:hypothetical protein
VCPILDCPPTPPPPSSLASEQLVVRVHPRLRDARAGGTGRGGPGAGGAALQHRVPRYLTRRSLFLARPCRKREQRTPPSHLKPDSSRWVVSAPSTRNRRVVTSLSQWLPPPPGVDLPGPSRVP